MWGAIAQVAVALINTLTTMVAGEEASLANADNQRTARFGFHSQAQKDNDRLTPMLFVFGAIVIVMMVFKYSAKK
jgi:hypothetical protein